VAFKRTKIVCTIGPASWDPKIMRGMIEAGMNAARVNSAFADPDELDKVKNLVQEVSDEVNLMLDVKGPEIRLNKFPEPIPVSPGNTILIGNSDKEEIYPANYKDVYTYVKPGQRMVIGDGDVELKLEKISNKIMHCTVVTGTTLKPGKALNLPGVEYSKQVLTKKDKENLTHAMKTGWNSVSASFIKNAASAQEVKDFIKDSDMQLIAKIEDQEGVDNIDDILKIVDGIMIARGGLGVELGLEKGPIIQRILTEKTNDAGGSVITATQMLESMAENPLSFRRSSPWKV